MWMNLFKPAFVILTLLCSCTPVAEPEQTMNDNAADRPTDAEPRAYVLGEELRSATEKEKRWEEQQGGHHPRVIDGEYSFEDGDLNLLAPAQSDVDGEVRALCQRFAKSSATERTAISNSLSMDEFYVLIGFGKRAAVFGLRREETEIVRDGVIALAMIERERVDYRDILVSLSLLYHCATKLSDDPNAMFAKVATLAQPDVAELFLVFVNGSPEHRSIRASWGYDEVETKHGRGFIGWRFAKYEPKADLARIAIEISELVSNDKYIADNIEIASELPPVWLSAANDPEVSRVLSTVRGGASVAGSLRSGEHPEHHSQQFSVFLVETVDPADAQTLVRASAINAKDHFKIGVGEGSLFCLIVARSVVVGVEAFESQESLMRFSGGISEILKQYADEGR